jgi:hypothetical protein
LLTGYILGEFMAVKVTLLPFFPVLAVTAMTVAD